MKKAGKGSKKAAKKVAPVEAVQAAPVAEVPITSTVSTVTAGDKELFLASIAEAAYESYKARCAAERRGDLVTSRALRAEGKALVAQAKGVFGKDFRMKDWIAARKAFAEGR